VLCGRNLAISTLLDASQKMAFESEVVVIAVLLYYSKSKYVKRGIDAVPIKFGPLLAKFWMQVTLHL